MSDSCYVDDRCPHCEGLTGINIDFDNICVDKFCKSCGKTIYLCLDESWDDVTEDYAEFWYFEKD